MNAITVYALCKKADARLEQMIHDMEGMTISVVEQVPSASEASYNVMYLVDTNGDGRYEAYIKADVDGTPTMVELGPIIDLSAYYTSAQVDTLLAGKQALLTWDNTPTSGSSNAISSGAIYNALEGVHRELTQAQYDQLTPAEKNNGTVYFITDAETEGDFSGLEDRVDDLETSNQSALHYKGTTTTPISNGSMTNPITINGEEYTAVFGDIVVYRSSEFIFDDTAWSEIGRGVDATPTSGSANFVTSDGVYKVTPFLRATGTRSVKGGEAGNASGNNAFAFGIANQAPNNNMVAFGKYNSPRTGDLFNIGNGTGLNTRSNIVEVNSTSVNINGDIEQNGASLYVELTKAQYDALTPEEKSSETVYFITDAEAEYGFSTEQLAVINSNIIALSYPNLVDKDAEGVTKNGYYNAQGTWIDAEGFYQSDYIPVTEGKMYTSKPHNVFVLWFDEGKNYIGQTTSVNFNSLKYVIAPVDAKYGKFMTTSDYYDTWQVENSMFSTEYVSYGEAISYKNTSYNGMSGVAFGTSITARAYTHGIGYLLYLQRMSGVVWDDLGIGSGQIYTNDTNLNILAKIKSKDSAYYATKGVCIIEGFVNDWYQNNTLGVYTDATETTVCGCLRSAINHILTANPTITLFIVFDHYGKGITSETEVNASGLTQYDYYEELAKVADSMSVYTIKVYKNSGINHYTANMYLADNIHLNELGAKQEANTIWQSMASLPAKTTG